MNQLSRPIASRMSRDEFLVWDAPSPYRWQLIDGEPVEMAPTTKWHGTVHAELIRLIGNHLVDTGSVCRVIAAPGVVPRFRPDINFRIPDVGVTAESISDGQIFDSPILVAEILSPSNEKLTRKNVAAYATIPSVQDILLLRSSRIEAELLRRDPDGNWPADPAILTGDATLSLDSIGFTTALAVLYRTTGLKR